MREYTALMRRIALAMGIYAGGAMVGCEGAKEAGQTVDATVIVDSGSTASDGASTPEDATEPADAAADVTIAVDTGPEPTDTAPTGDPTTPDVEAPDVEPDPGPPPEDVVVDTGTPNDASTVDASEPWEPSCDDAVETCYTADQLIALIENPPFGGKPGASKPYDGPLPPHGCPDPSLVLDGCCNEADGPGNLEGDTCCYFHCPGACCGRPLTVGDEALVATLTPGSAWATPPPPGKTSDRLANEDGVAEALAAAWRADALDEHASVASFMRFGLELMHLGAPPALIDLAAAAARDEVRHAQHCVTIAASLDGLNLEPGALDCSAVVARPHHAEIAAACVYEGCVGETIAAAQLSRAARSAPAELAATLRSMADDEARHAELAWGFVAWSWQTGDAEVRHAIHHAFEHVFTGSVPTDSRADLLANVDDPSRRTAGRLRRGEAATVAADTLRQVIAPNAAALFAS